MSSMPDVAAMNAAIDHVQRDSEQEYAQAFQRIKRQQASRFYIAGWQACLAAIAAGTITVPESEKK